MKGKIMAILICALMMVGPLSLIVSADADDTHVYIIYYDNEGNQITDAEIGDIVYAHIKVNTTQEIDTWQYQWMNFSQYNGNWTTGNWTCSNVTIDTFFASAFMSSIGTVLNVSGQIGNGTFEDATYEMSITPVNNANATTVNLTMDATEVGVVNITFAYVSGGESPFLRGGSEVQYTFHDNNLTIHPQYPQSFTATSYGQSQINLSWTKGTGADKTLIKGKLGSLPTGHTDGAFTYNDTGSTTTDTVGAGEHWYYKAWSWNTTESLLSYNNATGDDTTGIDAPSVIINFAGNLSDSGGPYYRPPGESTQLADVWSDGYYTNDSRQHEDWIYINCTITNATTVYLDWLNETTWTNGTYALSNPNGNWWEINTSSLIQTCEEYNYSFNINATGSGGNTIYEWNKTGIGMAYTRRYIQLDCSPSDNISYIPFYLHNSTYTSGDLAGRDRLRFDGGPDGSLYDTGSLTTNSYTDEMNERHCNGYVGWWFEEPVTINSKVIDNIYYHMWWSTNDGIADQFGYKKTRDSLSSAVSDYYSSNASNEKSSIIYDNGEAEYSNSYSLEASLYDTTTDKEYTDNDIYEFALVLNSGANKPSVISNLSISSFVLFNVPSNVTLQGYDSDSDSLTDYEELYITYTNPFLADTDADGVNDYWENLSNSDPNNYTETINSTHAPTLGTPTPGNGTGSQELSFSWGIPISDADGDTFNWTIECNNSQMSDADGSSNGTKYLPLSGLAYTTTYTVWVNVTDSYDWAREWFTFTTRSETVPGIPGSFTAIADGRFEIDLSWTKGSNADYTYIEWRAVSGTWNRGDETELYNNTGTSTSQSVPNPSTTRYYQAWSYNTTDNAWSSSYATSHDTTDSNTAPVFGSENPTNGTGSQELSFGWSIPINDADGDTFNWTIECNNSQSSNANDAANGTKSLSLSGLVYSTTYTIWVNATDSFDSVSEWFTFITKDAPPNDYPTFGTPNPTNGSTDVSHSLSSWTIPIADPEGDSINWSIDTSPDIGNASETGESNGTKSCTLSGLSYSTTYTVFVNATDDGSGEWTNQTFWFETEDSPNQNPNPPVDPDPENNEPDVPVNVGEFSCLVTDPDGDSLDCSAYWANHTLIDTNNSVANNTIVHFDVGTLEKDTTYEWYVNVSDNEFTVQSAIWNFTTVDNYAPVASFTVEYNNATRQVWMNDTSTDSDGTVVFWSWDFGDSSSVVHTQDAVHIYDTGGSFTIELAVIDNDGGTDDTTDSILLNYAPVASYIFTVSDMNITLNSTSTDSDGSIANYTLDWNDGNYSYTANATHEYTVEGTYLVNLTVTDDEGSVTSTWNAITVPPAPSSGFSFAEVNWLVWATIIAVVLCGVFFIGMVWKR